MKGSVYKLFVEGTNDLVAVWDSNPTYTELCHAMSDYEPGTIFYMEIRGLCLSTS